MEHMWWVPLSVECPQAFDAIGLIVQSAGAGVTADFALVGDAGGYPGTVLGSSTGVSLTTATDASKVGRSARSVCRSGWCGWRSASLTLTTTVK